MISIFHVHTYRCKHTDNIKEFVYIEKAIKLGATDIWFTDHAPFPNNPFGNRMDYEELEEYIKTLQELKERYKDDILVHIGLEIEYIPSYKKKGYYRNLYNDNRIELLMLGQHMAEISPGRYSYELSSMEKNEREHILLGNSIINGLNSGYFKVVAHPDRIFRRIKIWDDECNEISREIIRIAEKNNIFMEQNESSKMKEYHFRPEFWNNVKRKDLIIRGLDAHALEDIKII